MDDSDYSSTLVLVEDCKNDVRSTLAALSEGRLMEMVFIARAVGEAPDDLLCRAAYRSQAVENSKAGLPGLNDKPFNAAERGL